MTMETWNIYSIAMMSAAGRATRVMALLVGAGMSFASIAAGGLAGGQPRDPAAPTPILLAQAAGAGPSAQADLDALVKAARAEGQLLWFSSQPEAVSKQTSDAFTAKYGIKAVFLRGSSNPLMQRYSAEAEAGNLSADLIMQASNSVVFAEDGIKKGWMESISEAGLPVLKSGEFPARFNMGPSAIVQMNPWLIAYNTEKVKGADVPKDWQDILNPKFQGQIILFDPATNDGNYFFWQLLLDTYGESFFTRLRSMNSRFTSGGIPASQALAAGEGSFTLPATAATFAAMKAKGVPVSTSQPQKTNGAEYHVILTNRARARNPNAARLFVNYVMTREGNTVLSKDSGGISIYDTAGLPKQYETGKKGGFPDDRRPRIRELIGVK
jgi:iron(III) transport system substrate-binding protein